MSDRIYIFPVVRSLVSRLASTAAWSCLAGLLFFIVSESYFFLCLPSPASDVEIVSIFAILHLLSLFLYGIAWWILPLLIHWCHNVLLARKGYAFTRYLTLLSLFLLALQLVCLAYTACTRERLLPKQDDIDIIQATLMLVIILGAQPFAAAAPVRYRAMSVISGLTMLTLCIISLPYSPTINLLRVICTVVLTLTLFPLLRALARYAPLVVSMPREEE